ncbi:aminotransferase class III-fold pyridoxal phosphate-dependent enzyme [Mesorhizobium shangrilense]|uniref:Aminotransferase class III-fold pyridoxal phosphate-dependent enzyme n=1 Tax=Mesorhizobium shangrilense TaxID=460060 RepID=A0ABV2DEQ0_9HYPH
MIGVFAHGFTGSGHPVAAAVALENIRIIEERDLVGSVRRLAPRFRWQLDQILPCGLVREARSAGLIGAFESNAAAESPIG